MLKTCPRLLCSFAPSRIQTHNLSITSPTLYPLCHRRLPTHVKSENIYSKVNHTLHQSEAAVMCTYFCAGLCEACRQSKTAMTAVIKNWSHLNWTVTENTPACLAGNLHIHKQYMHALHALTKKVKASRICYRALGPELIPVYRQSARR